MIKNIITRFILAILTIFLYKPLLFILTPLTLYPIYFLLQPYKPLLQNTSLIINSTTITISEPCLAILAYLLLLALTILTPKISLKTRFKIFFTGSLIILITNLIRILILSLLIIHKNTNLFLTLHLFIWKFLSSIFVLLIWIFLTKHYKIKTIPIYTDVKYLIKQIKQE